MTTAITATAPNDAVAQILAGTAPANMAVDGPLKISGSKVESLPPSLRAGHLALADCPNLRRLPEGLHVRKLVIENCPQITELPTGLACNEVIAAGSRLTTVPADIRVDYRLDLRDSLQLESLPAGLTLGTLNLRGCTALAALPAGLAVTFLNLEGCAQLREWPADIRLGCGELNLAGTNFVTLPPGLTAVARLDLRNCSRIKALPEGLDVRSWIDVGGAGITVLPESVHGVQIRWRGVTVSERIALRPETLTTEEILAERNAEVRRVMLERVGFDWFFEQVKAQELDKDRDPGGDRRLLRIDLPGDEALVCVTLNCPSTARRYVLRVPPATATCRHAAAWLAGFDDPADYRPLAET